MIVKTPLIKSIFRFVFTFFLCAPFAHGQQSLDVASIDPELKKNAYAVVRNASIKDVFSSNGGIETTVKETITILHRKGKEYLTFRTNYKKGSSKVRKLRLEYFDSNGKLLKSVKKKEFRDVPANQSARYISDEMLIWYSYEPPSYPVTMVYSYTKKQENTLLFSHWKPISDYNVSVKKSTYERINKTNHTITEKTMNLDSFNIVKVEDGYVMQDMSALSKEKFVPNYYMTFPHVISRPDFIQYESRKGVVKTWQEFGQWMKADLLANKCDLDPEQIRADLGIDHTFEDLSKKEKIDTLYKYMQSTTRYIFVGINEGGLEPMPASKVHSVKYGDCKALTIYMKNLLDIFGIDSHFTLVEAGETNIQGLFSDFPSNWPANHAILNIPDQGSDIWLECTANVGPMGFLGDFTDNRQVFVLDDADGQLTSTPRITNNTEEITIEGVIDPNGSIVGNIEHRMSGRHINNSIRLSFLEEEKLANHIKKSVLLPGREKELEMVSLSIAESVDTCSTLTFDFTAKGFGETSGEYILIPLKTFDYSIPKLSKDAFRYHPIQFYRHNNVILHATYKLPKGYVFDPVLEEKMESKYGSYTLRFTYNTDNNEVEVYSAYMLNEGLYEPKEYDDIKRFFDQVRRKAFQKFYISKPQ